MTVAALPSSPFMQRPANTESAASVNRTSDIIITKSKKQNALEAAGESNPARCHVPRDLRERMDAAAIETARRC
jgi:hypothetical protein